jgi:hypothetical protein
VLLYFYQLDISSLRCFSLGYRQAIRVLRVALWKTIDCRGETVGGVKAGGRRGYRRKNYQGDAIKEERRDEGRIGLDA